MKILLLAMTLTLWPPLVGASEEPPVLAKNPFSRPSSTVSTDARRAVDRDDGAHTLPVLNATMISGGSRLANVDGHILRAGDAIQGYTLVAIFEEYAVFRRGRKATTVYVKPHLVEEYE